MWTRTPLPPHIEEDRVKMLSSLLHFILTFYKLRTGRDFEISQPIGRESHIITICKELTKVFKLETNRLLINVPPGHGKSEIIIHFVAWALAHYPDCQFIYISYGKDLAATHTATIKTILELPFYRKLFGVEIDPNSSAKDNFKTTAGGQVSAFGSSGPITGRNAGLPNLDRFSGAILMDDMHKPDEVHSDTMRESVISNFNMTIKPRPRSPNVPFIGIGQRLHEADLWAYLISGKDGYEWLTVILRALDEAGNALHPKVNPKEMLLIEKETNPYVFSAQYQQDPQPAGGGIFKPEWFVLLDNEPNIVGTFVTVDTAETDKDYNDATVFSFWGIYKIMHGQTDSGLYGLHWLNCVQIRVEPHQLEGEFMQFYADCMQHKCKPQLVVIEKKSTGVTLLSVIQKLQGLRAIHIEHHKNKVARFLETQPYVSTRRVSLHRYAKHTGMCLEHCKKITANNSHAFDDIADTLSDAVRAAFIDKLVLAYVNTHSNADKMATQIMDKFRSIENLKAQRKWQM